MPLPPLPSQIADHVNVSREKQPDLKNPPKTGFPFRQRKNHRSIEIRRLRRPDRNRCQGDPEGEARSRLPALREGREAQARWTGAGRGLSRHAVVAARPGDYIRDPVPCAASRAEKGGALALASGWALALSDRSNLPSRQTRRTSPTWRRSARARRWKPKWPRRRRCCASTTEHAPPSSRWSRCPIRTPTASSARFTRRTGR